MFSMGTCCFGVCFLCMTVYMVLHAYTHSLHTLITHTHNTHTHLTQVKYAALSNFEEREEDFRAEAVMLRRRFSSDGV